MKFTMPFFIVLSFLLLQFNSYCQSIPKPADPCEKLDTNTIKTMLIGTWVEMQDTTHIITVTSDSIEETIIVYMGKDKKDKQENDSYWNYRFEDNVFSSDQITCYSLLEYKEGFKQRISFAINSIDAHYLLLGASGKRVFKKRE